MSKLPKYIISRNKITRLVDVIDTETMKPISSHRNHDKAEAEAGRLLRAPSVIGDDHHGG